MYKKLLVFIPIALSVGAAQVQAGMLPVPGPTPLYVQPLRGEELATTEMSLKNRHANEWVNDVFADNMLLNLAYLSGDVKSVRDIDWNEVRKPKTQEFVLQPGEVFAFHDTVMQRYQNNVKLTTNTHFNAQDGYRSSGLLYGDGVCHLASLFNRAAHEAGLHVLAPVNHDFAPIPELPREFGTAIYYDPFNPAVSEQQNLYIQNTYDKPVIFRIETTSEEIIVRVALEK